MMTTTTRQMASFYNEKLAASQLRKYREKGPILSTQGLIDALKAEGVEGATLLDVGGGIGAIQHELLAAGVSHATSVDASAPYLEAAREESNRGLRRHPPAAEIERIVRESGLSPHFSRSVDRRGRVAVYRRS